MIYIQLFFSFLQVGLFSFGGGYAAMPLIQGQVVTMHQWLSMSEFTDLITISQMTPGPIAVNSATFVGIKIAGVPGALAATFGCILPSCILVTLLAKLYLKYREMAMLQGILRSLRPAVVAMIGSAGISILVTAFWSSEGDTVIRLAQTNWSLVVIFIISLILLQKGKKNPIFVMVLAGVMKVAVALVEKFAIKFLSDSSFQDLEDGLKEKDAEKAFRAAHTLKGICLNLGFDAFYEVSAALTEKLRGRELTGYEADFAAVKECYEKTVAAIKAFEESN